jgi:hypothetical protein
VIDSGITDNGKDPRLELNGGFVAKAWDGHQDPPEAFRGDIFSRSMVAAKGTAKVGVDERRVLIYEQFPGQLIARGEALHKGFDIGIRARFRRRHQTLNSNNARLLHRLAAVTACRYCI